MHCALVHHLYGSWGVRHSDRALRVMLVEGESAVYDAGVRASFSV